ncbi:hypothetical protein [Cupriavidus metallidurans]|uniref:Uncharacterized protein n=1 Tax=Cupriavidus metallidurans (strain ATCC 43123 / DSM 2839 / NBRC 102507 / CH34) TaxID=266264 RepID=Q1LLS8_CUPMC|nr:hypothetical protein [Cupriavidus metallidurans]ABF08898.1 hypothetical protein Rmet_2019 [Cupriavidus metallidurans CH34]QGS30200.1 hypothetical protein FOB83_15625 [Cupriavidus metallidurans]
MSSIRCQELLRLYDIHISNALARQFAGAIGKAPDTGENVLLMLVQTDELLNKNGAVEADRLDPRWSAWDKRKEAAMFYGGLDEARAKNLPVHVYFGYRTSPNAPTKYVEPPTVSRLALWDGRRYRTEPVRATHP